MLSFTEFELIVCFWYEDFILFIFNLEMHSERKLWSETGTNGTMSVAILSYQYDIYCYKNIRQ